jgi:predicted acyltransferase
VRTLISLTVIFLLGYWVLMTLVPVPGIGAANVDEPDGHLSGWIDRVVFGEHLWQSAKVYDPEGILSTVPALATTLFGVFAGLLLIAARDPVEKVARLFVAGSLLVGVGYVWDWFFPINKPIWTSSYAVFTAGLAFCCLALCLWFFDIRGENPISKIFVIYGVNAIVLFVGSGIIARTLSYARVGGVPLKKIIYDTVFAWWLPPYPASLAYAITWILGWYFVLAWMYRRNFIVKV